MSERGNTERRMLKPRQLSAALKLLGWNADDLALASGTSRHTIFAYVSRGSDPKLSTTEAWIAALHRAGCVLLDPDDEHGLGVRLSRDAVVPAPVNPPPGKAAARGGRRKAS